MAKQESGNSKMALLDPSPKNNVQIIIRDSVAPFFLWPILDTLCLQTARGTVLVRCPQAVKE